jgi:hypothetical protein
MVAIEAQCLPRHDYEIKYGLEVVRGKKSIFICPICNLALEISLAHLKGRKSAAKAFKQELKDHETQHWREACAKLKAANQAGKYLEPPEFMPPK